MKMIEKIKIAREKNNEVVRIVKEMKKFGIKILRDEELQVKEELILKEEKIYTKKKSFRQKLFGYTIVYQQLDMEIDG